MIPMPNYAITVSQKKAHSPKNTLSKGNGWGKESLLWSVEQNESDIKLNFILNNSAYVQRFLQTVSLCWKTNIFTSDNGFFGIIF